MEEDVASWPSPTSTSDIVASAIASPSAVTFTFTGVAGVFSKASGVFSKAFGASTKTGTCSSMDS